MAGSDDVGPRAFPRRLLALGKAEVNPVERLRRFFNHTIWEDPPGLSPVRSFFYPKLRVLTLSCWNFEAHGLPTHAAALTYTSLLALVPVLAVAFSLFQVFGGLEGAQQDLMEVLVRYIAPGMEASAKESIQDFTANIRSGARANAILATILLFVTVIRTLASLEATFNTIFGVKKGRAWSSRIAVYWAVATLGPVLLGGSITMTTSLKSSVFVHWLEEHAPFVNYVYGLAPTVLTSLAFAVLYLFLPNAKVKPRAALVGGIVAGIVFEVAKAAFTTGAVKLVGSYNQVYGSIATLFVFLFWLYISWTILLVGLELVVATQSATTHRKEELATSVSQRFRETIALRMVTEVCDRFHRGEPPPTVEKISAALDVPDRLLFDVIGVLEDAGLVRRVEEADDQAGFLPSRALERITVKDVVDALREAGATALSVKQDEQTRYLAGVVEAADAASSKVWGEETMQRVVERLDPGRREGADARKEPSVAIPAHS